MREKINEFLTWLFTPVYGAEYLFPYYGLFTIID